MTDSDARRLAQAIGLLGSSGPRSAVMLISPGASTFELLVRGDDLDLERVGALCEVHGGPMVLVSNRAAGSRVSAADLCLFDSAADVAASFGAILVDWLVVEGDEVCSLGWDDDLGWVVRSPHAYTRDDRDGCADGG